MVVFVAVTVQFLRLFYLTFYNKMLGGGWINYLISSLQPALRNRHGRVWVGGISVSREAWVPPRT